MTAGSAASRRVLARTPVAPLPASSPTRPVGITGRTSAPPDSSLPEVCSFQLPKVCSFRLPLTSPAESDFLALMRACFRRWKDLLSSEGNCVLVMGDACSRENRSALPDAVTQLARESGFVFADHRTDVIPSDRRVRQGITGSLSETILVLRKGGAAR